MMKLLHVFLVVGLVGCVGGPSSRETLQISDFRQGLLDMTSWPAPPVMTAVGNDFPFRINGGCIVTGEHRPCMWYGFEFSYEGSSVKPVLDCTAYFDEPSAVANPTTDYGRDLLQHSWQIKLPGRKGHYIHPEYTAGSSDSEQESDSAQTPGADEASDRDHKHSNETVCLFAGKEVLRFRFTIRYGAEPPSQSD